MTVRTRKFVGVIAVVSFLTVYCLLVMAFAANYITNLASVVQLIFFIFAGLAWLPVVMRLIRWMQKP